MNSEERNLVIKVKATEFSFDGEHLTISVPSESEVVFMPDGVHEGLRWFKPLSIGTARDLLHMLFAKHGD